jgi:hypothetical protein
MLGRIEHIYFNINRIYRALLMVAPMVVLILMVMRSMYGNKMRNLLLNAGFIGLFIFDLFPFLHLNSGWERAIY